VAEITAAVLAAVVLAVFPAEVAASAEAVLPEVGNS
jgi:hypothetical protein